MLAGGQSRPGGPGGCEKGRAGRREAGGERLWSVARGRGLGEEGDAELGKEEQGQGSGQGKGQGERGDTWQ